MSCSLFKLCFVYILFCFALIEFVFAQIERNFPQNTTVSCIRSHYGRLGKLIDTCSGTSTCHTVSAACCRPVHSALIIWHPHTHRETHHTNRRLGSDKAHTVKLLVIFGKFPLVRSTIHTHRHTYLWPFRFAAAQCERGDVWQVLGCPQAVRASNGNRWRAGRGRQRECFTHSRATDRQFSQFMTGNLFRVARSKRADKCGRKPGWRVQIEGALNTYINARAWLGI